MSLRRDIDKDISVAQTLTPAARTATATGTTVDLAGFNVAAFVVAAGTVTDGTHTPDPEESDDGSAWSNIAAQHLSGTPAAIVTGAVQEIGYLGSKRYVRMNVTVAGATTGGVYGCHVIRSGARTLPQ